MTTKTKSPESETEKAAAWRDLLLCDQILFEATALSAAAEFLPPVALSARDGRLRRQDYRALWAWLWDQYMEAARCA